MATNHLENAIIAASALLPLAPVPGTEDKTTGMDLKTFCSKVKAAYFNQKPEVLALIKDADISATVTSMKLESLERDPSGNSVVCSSRKGRGGGMFRGLVRTAETVVLTPAEAAARLAGKKVEVTTTVVDGKSVTVTDDPMLAHCTRLIDKITYGYLCRANAAGVTDPVAVREMILKELGSAYKEARVSYTEKPFPMVYSERKAPKATAVGSETVDTDNGENEFLF